MNKIYSRAQIKFKVINQTINYLSTLSTQNTFANSLVLAPQIKQGHTAKTIPVLQG
jgi:hypothetical protein